MSQAKTYSIEAQEFELMLLVPYAATFFYYVNTSLEAFTKETQNQKVVALQQRNFIKKLRNNKKNSLYIPELLVLQGTNIMPI